MKYCVTKRSGSRDPIRAACSNFSGNEAGSYPAAYGGNLNSSQRRRCTSFSFAFAQLEVLGALLVPSHHLSMELGTIAAAAQFVDMGCRSLFGVYRFVKNLKDVPADLVAALEDLGHFASLMHDLQSALESDNLRLRKLGLGQLDRVGKILDSTGQVCSQLEQLLAPCCLPPNASRSTRAWRALVSVKKEQDIIKICERLERLKHDLNRELRTSNPCCLFPLSGGLGSISCSRVTPDTPIRR